MPITARPLAASRWATWKPMNPAAPVTRIGSAAIDFPLIGHAQKGLGRSRRERQACCAGRDRCYRSGGYAGAGLPGPAGRCAERDMDQVRRPSRMDARTRPAPRLLYVVTEDWYFLSHRLPMARAARAAGFEVHVATNIGTDADAIEREGFTLHPVRFVRGRLSPFRSIGTILALRRVRRDVAPAIVHHVALQASVLGVVAAFARGGANVYAITGLGHAFIAPSGKARFMRSVIRLLLRFGLNRRRAVGLVQNP